MFIFDSHYNLPCVDWISNIVCLISTGVQDIDLIINLIIDLIMTLTVHWLMPCVLDTGTTFID